MKSIIIGSLALIAIMLIIDSAKGDACICTANYEPVCGSDNKTYSNECNLNCQKTKDPNIKVAHQGACVNGTASGSQPPHHSNAMRQDPGLILHFVGIGILAMSCKIFGERIF